jgi:hypothetical protein
MQNPQAVLDLTGFVDPTVGWTEKNKINLYESTA